MTTIQLRTTLVKKINSIQDIEFLKALSVIIDTSQIRQQAFQLNDSQKKSIQVSRDEMRNGKYISHKDVIKKQDKWLKKYSGH